MATRVNQSHLGSVTWSHVSPRTDNPDKWYWDAIEKYKDDPEAYAYLSQNPWLRADNTFSSSLGQQVLSYFGDNSAENTYYNELRQKAQDYLSQWEKGMYEQKYNSPVEQVKREQAAGLNPDLDPASISPGSAAENDQPGGQTLGNPGAGDFGVVKELAGFGVQFLGSVLNFGKQIQDLNIGSMQRVGLELGAGNSARDYVLSQLAGMSDADLKNPSNVIKNIDLSTYSRSTRKFLQRYLERFAENSYGDGDNLALATEIAEYRNRMLRANRDSADILSSPYYDSHLNNWSSNIMEKYSKFVAAAEQYAAMAQAGLSEVEATAWQNEGMQNVYGDTLASELNARNQSAKSTAESAKYKTEMEKAWNELEKAVKGDGSHWYNTIGLVLLNFLRAQVSQPLHLGFSSSSMVSNSMGKNGTSHAESSSSGFHF